MNHSRADFRNPAGLIRIPWGERTCTLNMNDIEQKIRLAVGSAAAASAIFAPLSYKWKGVLAFVATDAILTGIYGVSPLRKLIRA